MNYHVVVVGGGIAGLTSAAYLSKAGYKVLVCEKEVQPGGLINSFEYKGFVLDGGIRAIENSGSVLPMLKQLGIEIQFVPNTVSIGALDQLVHFKNRDSLLDYQEMLNQLFPEERVNIQNIINKITQVIKYMDVLYGIDNPLFLDWKRDSKYMGKTILPWFFKYLRTVGKIEKLNQPIKEYLQEFTTNTHLIDIISQHFFEGTPAFFALSYFGQYLDYMYPVGGTGVIVQKMTQYITEKGGAVCVDTEISQLDVSSKCVKDSKGTSYHYNKLIWAADSKLLYRMLDVNQIENEKSREQVKQQREIALQGAVGDSVYTVYLTLDLDRSLLKEVASEHCFFTPSKEGLSTICLNDLRIPSLDGQTLVFTKDKSTIFSWLGQHFALTTYEISCPVLRDASLAPKGQSALIISTLLDYGLVKHIHDMGWYQEFKEFSEKAVLHVLTDSRYQMIQSKVLDIFSSSPLSIERITGNSGGAITGWSFTNKILPIQSKLIKIAESVLTPIPDIYQAGQWSFSPSGFPISILTGKMAADKIIKTL